jgi:hypothetical protein
LICADVRIAARMPVTTMAFRSDDAVPGAPLGSVFAFGFVVSLIGLPGGVF